MQRDKNTGITTLNPWEKGMNNRASSRNLPEGTVRNAVNADFGTADEIRGRKGVTKVLSCMNPKGGFSCPSGCFFIEGAQLKRFNADRTATTLFTGVTGLEFAFGYAVGVVYFSDGVINLKIAGGTVHQWGMSVPEVPTIYAKSGVYGAGVYLAGCCWVDFNGVESGLSAIVSLSCPEKSGIVFSGLPNTTDPQVQYLRLYLSTADGKELYHVADVSPGTMDYSISAGSYDSGNVCESQFISPPPPGRIIAFYTSRAYVADAYGVVWYSDEFSPDRFHLGSDYLQFPNAVDLMLPTTGGMYFAYEGKTEFYKARLTFAASDGVTEGFHVDKVFNYGAVFGTGRNIPNSDNVTWQSQRGWVVGTPEGKAKNMQEENVAVDSAVSGASFIREQDGLRQFVVSLQQPTTSGLAASSWIDAEIVRREA